MHEIKFLKCFQLPARKLRILIPIILPSFHSVAQMITTTNSSVGRYCLPVLSTPGRSWNHRYTSIVVFPKLWGVPLLRGADRVQGKTKHLLVVYCYNIFLCGICRIFLFYCDSISCILLGVGFQEDTQSHLPTHINSSYIFKVGCTEENSLITWTDIYMRNYC